MEHEKIGVVDAGGGYRGIYAAGVLDYCLENNIHFDLGIGVSAGSANIISYIAGQHERNKQFYAEYGLRKKYASLHNFIFKRSFLDLNYIYSTLSNSDGENPLDYSAIIKNPMEFVAVATEAKSGQAHYFTKDDLSQNDYSVMKASCAIPFVCHPYAVRDTLYYDGALSDPIPFLKAFEMGCDKVVLLLTLPEETVRNSDSDLKLAAKIRRKYPISAEQMEHRAKKYNDSIALAREYAAQGKLLFVAPDDTCGVHTLCRDADALLRFYEKGKQDGKKIKAFLGE